MHVIDTPRLAFCVRVCLLCVLLPYRRVFFGVVFYLLGAFFCFFVCSGCSGFSFRDRAVLRGECRKESGPIGAKRSRFICRLDSHEAVTSS